MISIVIPLYNKEKSVLNTISSVLKQTYQEFEIIVVNDGSSDKSLEVVRSINDKRIIIVDKKNGGVSSARNEGIKVAQYDHIAFIDGDDLWLPGHLETIVDMINEYSGPDIGGYSTRFIKSDKSDVLSTIPNSKGKSVLIEDYLRESSINDSLISSSNFAARKECFNDVGLYDENLIYGEDLELYYRLFKKYKLVVNDSLTAVYFTGAENRSNKKVIPLAKRFHKFDFTGKPRYEKIYLAKLVSIIILDYSMLGAYNIAYSVFYMYKRHWLLIIRYYNKIIMRKISKTMKLKLRFF